MMKDILGHLIVFVCLMACADTTDRLIKDRRYVLALIVLICMIFLGVAWIISVFDTF